LEEVSFQKPANHASVSLIKKDTNQAGIYIDKYKQLKNKGAYNALNYYYLGEYAKGKLILEESYWQEYQFKNEDVLPMLYDLKGVFYFTLGDIEKSKETLETSLDLSLRKELKSTADSSNVANHFNNLGTVFNTKGDPQRALDYYLQAEAFYSNEGNDLESKIKIFDNIGKLYHKNGGYE
jgi:tetratricopeptide (TPR) repeat protein